MQIYVLIEVWKEYFNIRRNKFIAPVAFSLISALLIIYPKFLNFIEARQGISLNDSILLQFQPIDCTWLIFGTLYLSIIAVIFYLSKKPDLLVKGILAYSILIATRMTAMYMVPLEPPKTMLLLNDPFVQFFGTGNILTKDLFFSGHTSMMFLLALVVENRWLKTLLFAGTLIIGISVILQHVHYPIDVFAAPFFSFASYNISELLLNRRAVKTTNIN